MPPDFARLFARQTQELVSAQSAARSIRASSNFKHAPPVLGLWDAIAPWPTPSLRARPSFAARAVSVTALRMGQSAAPRPRAVSSARIGVPRLRLRLLLPSHRDLRRRARRRQHVSERAMAPHRGEVDVRGGGGQRVVGEAAAAVEGRAGAGATAGRGRARRSRRQGCGPRTGSRRRGTRAIAACGRPRDGPIGGWRGAALRRPAWGLGAPTANVHVERGARGGRPVDAEARVCRGRAARQPPGQSVRLASSRPARERPPGAVAAPASGPASVAWRRGANGQPAGAPGRWGARHGATAGRRAPRCNVVRAGRRARGSERVGMYGSCRDSAGAGPRLVDFRLAPRRPASTGGLKVPRAAEGYTKLRGSGASTRTRQASDA